jgi:hypothetical protein
MDAVSTVCFFVVAVGTCIVVLIAVITIVVTNTVIKIISIDVVVVVAVVIGYCLIQIEPFFIYFVRTMDAVGIVCFFVIVVGTYYYLYCS